MVCLSYSLADNSSVLEEQFLLNRLAQGDRQAFWQLWALHQDYLYHRCRVWMGGNHDDAREAMSLASLKAWHKLSQHALKITNLKGWLNRFTHNLCMDIHRQHRRQAVSTENLDAIPLDTLELETCGSARPESVLLQQELSIYLRYYIEALPARLRHPLILYYYQEMSYADIAQKLSISPNNVCKRLLQAKMILKQQLSQYASGANTTAIDDAQFQKLERKDFQTALSTVCTVEEINYGVTVSCLETLPPAWCHFHQAQDWR